MTISLQNNGKNLHLFSYLSVCISIKKKLRNGHTSWTGTASPCSRPQGMADAFLQSQGSLGWNKTIWAIKKTLVGSFKMGIIFLYPVMWGVIRCHEIMIPSLNNQYFMESKGPRLFFMAHLEKFTSHVGEITPITPIRVFPKIGLPPNHPF